MTTIYGVDTTQSVTAPMVRDAIIRCFCLAHADHAELDDTNPNFTEQYCATIVRKAFQETGGDFDHPTRQSLENTLPWLASFSKILS